MRYLVIVMSLLFVAACGDHYTTQEAYTACDELTERVTTTPDDSFTICVACFEDCGDDCQSVSAADGHFACPED